MSHHSTIRLFAIVVVVCLAAGVTTAQAGTISLAWDPVAHSDLSGYRVFYDTTAGSYAQSVDCLLYTSPSPRDATLSRMPSSA